jgi:mRNA interferase MazF
VIATAPARGHVYRADLGYGLKPWLVVSNNARNRVTADVLAVRLTTTKRELPTWVPLAQNDPLGGYVNTDNIETLAKNELGEYLGTLSPASMLAVNRALSLALGLS